MAKPRNARLLGLVKDVLYARRSGNVAREQRAWDRLDAHCQKIGVDAGEAIEQGRAWLSKNSIAAHMNGLI